MPGLVRSELPDIQRIFCPLAVMLLLVLLLDLNPGTLKISFLLSLWLSHFFTQQPYLSLMITQLLIFQKKEPLLLFTSTSKWYPKCEIQSEAFFIAIEHG
jgi:hypothetical protein